MKLVPWLVALLAVFVGVVVFASSTTLQDKVQTVFDNVYRLFKS